jgi:hypothetical protein
MVLSSLPRISESDPPARVIELAFEALREQVPSSWSLSLDLEPTSPGTEWKPDAVIDVTGPGSRRPTRLIVAFRSALTPRVASNAAMQLRAVLSQDATSAGVLIAPWASRRTRDLLRDSGIGFIDPTGNIDLSLDEPALVVRVAGASENPLGRPARSPSLRGPKAWALMKTLIEVKPVYGVRQLASAAGTDAGYTSRVIRALEEERLVFRTRRGPIEDVDWDGLLTQLTGTYGLLSANTTSTWIARSTIRTIPDRLANQGLRTPWAITGSLGAALIAPIAAPAMAIIYADDPSEIAESLELLPADSGANVVLAQPYEDAVFARCWTNDGARYVSVAQLAADCLTGMGRMPAEGSALVEWMTAHEPRWRVSGFDEAPRPVGQ